MLTKTDKNGKNLKIENFEKKKEKKNGLAAWWRGSYPHNLAMQRFLRNLSLLTTDGRRTMDACAMKVALQG